MNRRTLLGVMPGAKITAAFLEVQGDKSDGIVLAANDLTRASTAVSVLANVAPGAVSQAGNVTKT